MTGVIITKKRVFLFLVDLLLLPLALFLAYYIRFDGAIPLAFIEQYKYTLVLFLIVRIAVNYFYGLYKGLWRYLGIHDMITIFKAITLGTLIIMVGIFWANSSFRTRPLFYMHYPRSIYVIEWLFSLLFVGGTRFLIRIYRDVHIRKSIVIKEILIVGAGNAGEMLVRDILRNPKIGYLPVGFVDDDIKKVGDKIHNVKILGTTKDIPEIIDKKNIKEIIISIPSASSKEMREIVKYCQESGCPYRTMPGINDIVDGRVNIQQIRNVDIEDLLGREKVDLDIPAISSYLKGKVIMITGAGGSIGTELVRQVVKYEPATLVMVDNNENSVYYLDLEFDRYRSSFPVYPIVEDICSEHQMRDIFSKYNPQVVFHAAAHKHVHLMERFPEKAVRNNVFGTLNVCRLAAEAEVEKFILISTDKAVNPTSMMGATKRIAELIVHSQQVSNKTKFMSVRFGNVLGSSGSVIPLFKRQISKGGPITITHPDMNRYFMTIPEAVQLVIQAGAIGSHGDVLVLDMGEPVRIVDLAKELIRLSGLEEGQDIEIIYTGLRPGEKVTEELFSTKEGVNVTKYKKIFIARQADVDNHKLLKHIKDLENILNKADQTRMMHKIKEIIPEYRQ